MIPSSPSPRLEGLARHWRAGLVTLLLAVVGYALLVGAAGARDVAAAIAHIGVTGAAILLGLSLVNYLLRFARWQLYLRAMGHPQPWGYSLRVYIAGFALTTTPGKAGEMLRAGFLHQAGVPLRTGTAAFFSERLSDLTAVTLLATLGVSSYPALRPLVAVMLGAVVVLHLLVIKEGWAGWLAGRFASQSRAGRVATQLLAGVRDTAHCHRPGLVLAATLLSFVAWAAEAWGLHLVLQWLDGRSEPAFSMFTYAAGMLVGAISFLPGGLGGTEAVMMGLLAWAGHPQAVAAAATVIVRVATLWFAVVLGCATLALLLARPGARAASPREAA